jgi:hypothetical protein
MRRRSALPRGKSGPEVDFQGILCDGTRADGARCGQSARLLVTRYIYGLAADEHGKPIQALRETRYETQCKDCGIRTQVVRHHYRAN